MDNLWPVMYLNVLNAVGGGSLSSMAWGNARPTDRPDTWMTTSLKLQRRRHTEW